MNGKKITLDKLLEMIRSREGILLSTPDEFNFNKTIRVQCSHGHRWTAPAKSICRGNWCRECYLTNPKNNRPLSEDGVLHARCFDGHEWAPSVQEIIQDAKCPQCVSNKPKMAPRLSLLVCLARTSFHQKRKA